MIVLDTNALVWVTISDKRLGRKSRALFDKHWAAGGVAVSAITFWEVGLLEARKRLRLPAPVVEWRRSLLDAGVVELPLDGAVALRSLDLSGLPDDPADRFIAATALIHDAILMTADDSILDWRHGLERHDARV
ncbi:MAG: type II toxin-antitoxin system VapC family toxin [Pseudomonadota bacterium]